MTPLETLTNDIELVLREWGAVTTDERQHVGAGGVRLEARALKCRAVSNDSGDDLRLELFLSSGSEGSRVGHGFPSLAGPLADERALGRRWAADRVGASAQVQREHKP